MFGRFKRVKKDPAVIKAAREENRKRKNKAKKERNKMKKNDRKRK